MKITLFFILYLIPILSFGQPKTQKSAPLLFDFISDYPIKIDGCCSFYTYDTTALSTKKEILVVGAHETAFTEKNKSFIFFYRTKRTLSENGYTDYFENNQYKITVHITNQEIRDAYSRVVKGTLTVRFGNLSRKIAIHGVNQEYWAPEKKVKPVRKSKL